MSTSEESILLSLLPLFQKKLDIKQLQPFLKSFCSFTDEECDLICGPNAYLQKDSSALMLVEILRRKSSLCCAQMLLSALQQSCTKSGRHIWGHSEVVSALQAKLNTGLVNGQPTQSKAWNASETDSLSASSTQENSSMNYFPSATLVQSSLYDSGTSGHGLNGSGEHTHLNGGSHLANGISDNVEIVLSVGLSHDPAPTVEFKSPFCGSMTTEMAENLVMESRNIQSSFSDFVLEVCTLLQESSTIYIEKLQMWLSFQNCTGAVQSLKAFDGSSKALRAKSIPSLLSSLKSYSSWYNYGLIGDIAKRFCGNEGVQALERYELLLCEYMEKVIVHCPPPSPELEDESKHSEVLQMEVDLDFSATALRDLAIFKQTLCKVCDLDPRFLVLKRIDATNYHLLWAIPKVALPSAIRNLKSKWTCLEDKHVKSVVVSGQEIHKKVETKQTPPTSVNVKRSVSPSLSSIFDEIFSATTTCINNDLAYMESLTNGNASSSTGGSVTASSGDRQSMTSQVANGYSEETPLARKTEGKLKPAENSRPNGAFAQSETSTNSLLSEISESLNLLSLANGSAPSSSSPKRSPVQAGPSPVVTRVQSMVVPSPQVVQSERYSLNLNNHHISPPSPDFLMKKSVSFLWRVLGRANPECHANLYINAIYDVVNESKDELCVRKGQLLKALYRIGERIFVETLSMECGFVPYSSCRISRKYYGAKSKVIQLSYLQLYLQSPDGLDILPPEFVPSLQMVAMRDHVASSKEELGLSSGDVVTCMYCDTDMIYASCDGQCGVIPQGTCELVKKLQPFFKSWQGSNQKFQADFVIKRSEVRPAVLAEGPVTRADVDNHNCSSRIGKIFTVNQNFVPESPSSSNFTIRKGLRVKVIDENQKYVCVSTKTGSSFWIPPSYLKPARRNSDAEYNFQTPMS